MLGVDPRIRLTRLAVTSLLLTAGLLSGWNAPAPAAATESTTVIARPAFGDFLLPDGSLDMRGLRDSGFAGRVDPSRFRVELDGSTGAPRFEPVAGNRAPLSDDVNWGDRFGFRPLGTSWDVHCVLVYDGALIVGGAFTYAGDVHAPGIARWDGTAWSGLGEGMNGPVSALAEFDGALIAGGDFFTAGGVPASRIARWNGASWSALSSGETTYGPVCALAVYQGDLIVGGGFQSIGGLTVSGIARWTGTGWASLAAQGSDATVRSLVVYGEDLIAGGAFTSIGGSPANCVARWDGSSWHMMGTGMEAALYDPEVYAMAVFDGDLIATGAFEAAGNTAANNIARWDGSRWQAMGAGFDIGTRSAFVFDGRLYVGGAFTTAGGLPATNIAGWDGSVWRAVGGGTDGRVEALAAFEGKLIAGGWFSEAGGNQANRIARWDGSAWTAFGDSAGYGMDGDVTCLAVYRGELIAGGTFTLAGSVPAVGIARWDGARWRYLGGFEAGGGTVYALAVWGDVLVVGGAFSRIGGLVAPGIAKWDGTSWSTVSPTGTNESVFALVVYGGDLIAGGRFTSVDGIPVNRIARWDGVAWSPMGSGMSASGFTPEVYGLMPFGGDLIAMGPFHSAGGVLCNNVARWDGSAWHAMGAGFDAAPWVSAVYDSELVLGGAFTASGAAPLNHVARWDGAAWQAVGDGANHTVTTLAVHNDKLFAGGGFTQAGGMPANHVASWDGAAWSPMGSGTDTTVYALAEFQDLLYVGGAFKTAGLKASHFIGSWDDPDLVPVSLVSFSAARDLDGARLRWRIADPSDHAGFHLHRESDTGERVRLTESLLTGAGSYEFRDPDPPEEGARYWLAEWSRSGRMRWHGPAVLDPVEVAARAGALGAAHPNPFRNSTHAAYTLSAPGPVTLEVFDVAGRRIALLASGARPAGRHEAGWNGLTDEGERAAPGTYFLRLTTADGSASRGIVLLR